MLIRKEELVGDEKALAAGSIVRVELKILREVGKTSSRMTAQALRRAELGLVKGQWQRADLAEQGALVCAPAQKGEATMQKAGPPPPPLLWAETG